MKKILFVFLSLLLLAAACNQKSSKTDNQVDSQKQQLPSTQDSQADLKTYTNTQFGFEFKYPANFQIKEGELAGRELSYFIPPQMYFIETGTAVVTVAMPKGTFPATDLEGAFMAVNVGKNLTSVGCQQYDAKTPEQKFMTKIININGVEFFQAESGSAATGHQAFDTIYHTLYNNTCFEIVLGVRTGGFGAIESLKQVDQKAVMQRLEQVLNTFIFTK